MGSEGRRTIPYLIDQLFAEGNRFEFFQAVRLLERAAQIASRPSDSDGRPDHRLVGYDGPPSREAVRFRAAPSQSFAAASVRSIHASNDPAASPAAPRRDDKPAPPQMFVNFLGLTGPSGVMPNHYSRMVVAEKDAALSHFLDLFNHRILSLFYRACEKYRIASGFERADGMTPGPEPRFSLSDDFTTCLLSLVGLGTGGLVGRGAMDSRAILYFGGAYSRRARCAVAFEGILAEQFGVPASIRQFQGRWLELSPRDRSKLPGRGLGAQTNCQLGVSLVAGSSVWETQTKFRVRLGPLTYDQFCQLQPGTERMREMNAMIRLYVGPEFDYDIQPILRADQVPRTSLRCSGTDAPRLGRNTWSNSSPATRDFEGAVFDMNLSEDSLDFVHLENLETPWHRST